MSGFGAADYGLVDPDPNPVPEHASEQPVMLLYWAALVLYRRNLVHELEPDRNRGRGRSCYTPRQAAKN